VLTESYAAASWYAAMARHCIGFMYMGVHFILMCVFLGGNFGNTAVILHRLPLKILGCDFVSNMTHPQQCVMVSLLLFFCSYLKINYYLGGPKPHC